MDFSVRELTVIHESFGDHPEHFTALLHDEVVASGTPGGEAFVVNVVSPSVLARVDEPELGRGMVVATDYDLAAIQARLNRLVQYAPVTDWDSLVGYVDRYFDWV